MAYISVVERKQLLTADGSQCAYCQTTVENSGQPLTVDHIWPESQGGPTSFENLCFSCRRCNEFKGAATTGRDPATGQVVPLFHPRRERWNEHFEWDKSGTHIHGLTPVGRATIGVLNMNNDTIVKSRQRWVRVGWHPPNTT